MTTTTRTPPPPVGPPATRNYIPRVFVGFRTSLTGLAYIDQRAQGWGCNRSEAIRRILADHARRSQR